MASTIIDIQYRVMLLFSIHQMFQSLVNYLKALKTGAQGIKAEAARYNYKQAAIEEVTRF